MAKQQKPKDIVYNNGEARLRVSPKFVYDIEIFKHTPKAYNLEDSKFIQTPTYQKDSSEVFMKDGVRFKKYVTLISAPESWLIKNKFTIEP